MNKVLNALELGGIIPVVVIEDEERAVPLAQALLAGGLATMEITFRTDAARNAIDRIRQSVPEMLIGAGTVLTVDQVKAAVDGGAQYIVSPGLNRNVVEYCRSHDVTVTPGISTPSDVEAAIEFGLTVVKFFPAEASGGTNYLKAITAPYRQMRFIPTGGVDESNLVAYLRLPFVLACGGSWMVKAELIGAGNFDEITRLSSSAVATMLGLRLCHVGINNPGPTEAMEGARFLGSLLHMPLNEGSGSVFVDTQFELLKRNYLGAHGHLAIGTNFIQRAIAQFACRGTGIREETKAEKNGKLASVYLDKEVGGFAIHLLQL